MAGRERQARSGQVDKMREMRERERGVGKRETKEDDEGEKERERESYIYLFHQSQKVKGRQLLSTARYHGGRYSKTTNIILCKCTVNVLLLQAITCTCTYM